MKKTLKTKEDFEVRIKKYYDEEKKLLNSLSMNKRIVINFPNKKIGLFTKLAISFITASGGILDAQFFNLKK